MSLFVAAAVVIAAGCGGSSNASGSGTGGSGGDSGTGVSGGGGRGGSSGGSVGGGGSGGGGTDGSTGGSGGTRSTGTGGGCGAGACNHPPAQHRVQAATCSVDRTGGAGGASGTGGTPELCGGSAGAGGAGSICTGQNAACCHFVAPGGFGSSDYCAADECATDSDCGPMKICVCDSRTGACNRNWCQQAGCRIDADCGAGMYCSPSRNYPVLCQYAFMCHTPNDECVDDTDCNGGVTQGAYCAFDGTVMHWRCTSQQIADCSSLPHGS